MSGFLSNLIARSFTDAPVIQPRVPSLFETAGNEFVVEPQSPMFAIAARETIAPTNVPAPAPVSKSLPVRETITIKSAADVWDARAKEHLPKPDALADVSHARAEESLLKPDVPAAQNASVIAQAPRPSVHTTRVRKLELETRKVILPAESFRDRKEGAGERTRAPEALSKPPPIQIRRRKDFSPVEQGSSTLAPTIRVTIGRVEVRAIHPLAPAPKPAKPAPPKLSLEDYLRKRERGSR